MKQTDFIPNWSLNKVNENVPVAWTLVLLYICLAAWTKYWLSLDLTPGKVVIRVTHLHHIYPLHDALYYSRFMPYMGVLGLLKSKNLSFLFTFIRLVLRLPEKQFISSWELTWVGTYTLITVMNYLRFSFMSIIMQSQKPWENTVVDVL